MTTHKKINHVFAEGEVLKNNNGRDYKVIEIQSPSKILFQRASDGERVIATNPNLYNKSENGESTIVLEWDRGEYL